MNHLYKLVLLLGVSVQVYAQNTPPEEVHSEYIKSRRTTIAPTHYRASKAIVLYPGFSAKGQNSFTAKVQYFSLRHPLTTSALTVSPNPLQEESMIDVKLPKSGMVSLTVSNASGEPFLELIRNEYKEAGEYTLALNCKTWTKGVYILYLQTDEGISTFKMLKP